MKGQHNADSHEEMIWKTRRQVKVTLRMPCVTLQKRQEYFQDLFRGAGENTFAEIFRAGISPVFERTHSTVRARTAR